MFIDDTINDGMNSKRKNYEDLVELVADEFSRKKTTPDKRRAREREIIKRFNTLNGDD